MLKFCLFLDMEAGKKAYILGVLIYRSRKKVFSVIVEVLECELGSWGMIKVERSLLLVPNVGTWESKKVVDEDEYEDKDTVLLCSVQYLFTVDRFGV